jgi:hypothetical protein
MLQKLSEEIAECYRHASHCRGRLCASSAGRLIPSSAKCAMGLLNERPPDHLWSSCNVGDAPDDRAPGEIPAGPSCVSPPAAAQT